jgi:predicted DNA-binding transcriptional regulator AlpA
VAGRHLAEAVDRAVDNAYPGPDLLKEAEAAAMLRRPPGTLRDWRHRGEGPPYVRIGRLVAYVRSDLEDYIDAHRVDPRAS